MGLTPPKSSPEDAPGSRPPAPSQHPGDASLIWPPFLLLAFAAIVAVVLTRLLADSLRGEWFSMEMIGYFVGTVGYAFFAALFLWLDALGAASLRDATWPSRRGMWWRTVMWAFPALFGAVFLGAAFSAGLALLSETEAPTAVVQFVGAAVVVGVLVAGVVANVRARRRTHVAPDTLDW